MIYYHICENCSQPVLEKGKKICAKCVKCVTITKPQEKNTMAKKPTTFLKTQVNEKLMAAMAEHNGQLLIPTTLDVSNMLHLIDVNVSDTEGMNIATLTEEGWEYLGLIAPTPVEAPADDFVIESNIPITPKKAPNANGPAFSRCPYPFDRLEVGQSFLAPVSGDEEARKKAAITVVNWCSRWNRKNSIETGETKLSHKGNEIPVMRAVKKLETRVVDGGVRVWRTL